MFWSHILPFLPKNTFDMHFQAYHNWEIGCYNSKRLLICYCVECGLKCLIMKDNKIERIAQANQEIAEILGSHDFRVLLKAVKKAGTYQFKEFQTEFGDTVNPNNYHQLCRYCIGIKDGDMSPVEKFDDTLKTIAEWLKEVI